MREPVGLSDSSVRSASAGVVGPQTNGRRSMPPGEGDDCGQLVGRPRG